MMSTIVLKTAGKGFATAALKPMPSAPRNRRSGRSTAVICDLATLGDTYLAPLVTICCS